MQVKIAMWCARQKNLGWFFLVTSFFLSMSLKCANTTSSAWLFRAVTAPAHPLCFDCSLGQISLVSLFKWFSFQSSKLTLQEYKIFRLFFSIQPLFSSFLQEQIWSFLVHGLPVPLFPLLRDAKNFSYVVLSRLSLSPAESQPNTLHLVFCSWFSEIRWSWLPQFSIIQPIP